MALLTPKEFAELISITENNVATYFLRKKFVYTGDGSRIDTEAPQNALFIKERQEKAKKKADKVSVFEGQADILPEKVVNRVVKAEKASPKSSKNEKNQQSALAFDYKQEQEKLAIEIQKREIIKRDIDIEKKNGLLIPTELVKLLFLQHSKSITVSFRASLERMIDMFIIKYKLAAADASEMRKGIIDAINRGITDAEKTTKAGLKNLVAQFSETKERGEREK